MKNNASTKRSAKRKSDKAGDKLCAALAEWVKELDGVPMVIGPITVHTDRVFGFEVTVRVTGTPPNVKKFGKLVKRT